MASRNASFRLSSLTVWADIIEVPSLPSCLAGDADSADVLAAQEQASASRFAEVKCKLAADCGAMNAWNADRAKVASKQHVTRVLHEKAQIEQGKKYLDPVYINFFFFALLSFFLDPCLSTPLDPCLSTHSLAGWWKTSCKATATWPWSLNGPLLPKLTS